MKKKTNKKLLIIIVAMVCIIVVLVNIGFKKEVYVKNAEDFTDGFQLISFNEEEEVILEDLSSIMVFDWDKALFFGPYINEEDIYEIVGYKWRKSLLTNINEGMNQVVFLKNKEVVCHIQGYPSQYGVSFDIWNYEEANDYGDYIEIVNQENIEVALRNIDGIYYLRLLNDESKVSKEDEHSPVGTEDVEEVNTSLKMNKIEEIVREFMINQELLDLMFKSEEDYDNTFSMVEEREVIIGETVNKTLVLNKDILNIVILNEQEIVYEVMESPLKYSDLQRINFMENELYSYTNPSNSKEVIMVKKIKNILNNKEAYMIFVLKNEV